MKILYHCGNPKLNYQAPTGYGRHMRGMVKGFQHLGHEVVLDIAGGTEMPEEWKSDAPAQGKGKRILKSLIPSRIWESVKDFRLLKQNEACYHQLLEKAKAEKPDLIYERMSYLHDAGVRVGKELNIPVVLEVNTPFREAKEVFEGQTLLMSKAEKMEEGILKKADAIFPVSSAIREHYIEMCELDPSKIKVVPNAMDPEEFQVDEERVEELRKELGIEENETVIGFVGSIFPYHGVELLMDAFVELEKKWEGVRLLIVGDGASRGTLYERAERLAPGKVIFTGAVPYKDTSSYISLMDLGVMPRSNWFGSPVKIFEYGALGKPVIAPDTGPVKDVIKDGYTGKVIEMNKKAFIGALSTILSESDHGEAMGKRFQEKVKKEHTWKMQAEKLISYFEERINNG